MYAFVCICVPTSSSECTILISNNWLLCIDSVCCFNEFLLILCHKLLKSVPVHFAYGRIALTLGLLGRFLDEDDRCNPPVLLVPFSRLLGL